MGQKAYIFSLTPELRERHRLQTIERYHDPATRNRLLMTGIKAGWRCLEVGPGAGSVMRWLATKVGRSGTVTALDLNPRFLTGIRLPNVEICQDDIASARLPSKRFHLIHARFVLIHTPRVREALRRMREALKPGGWLVLEEPDFTAARPVAGTASGCRSFESVHRAIIHMFRHLGLDPGFGLQLPKLLQDYQFTSLKIEHDVPLTPGGSALATIMKLSA